ncbi:hypothetical protein, partial [Mailhella massiliensis]|uniref:hypothetical protein n=1 Tax=Mailhella massiliensis TaxID=1903261 RepID=UPI00194E2476
MPTCFGSTARVISRPVSSGREKQKAPQAAQGCAARRALNDERLLKRSLSKDNLGIGLLSHV